MQGRYIRRSHLHNSQTPSFGPRVADTMPDCRLHYANLCAFARDLSRENIEVFAWEDIMTAAFNRAWNNRPSRASAQNSDRSVDTWRAYMSGAEVWVSSDVVQKSLHNGRISRQTWRLWQDKFTEMNSATTDRPRQNRGNLPCQASRDIARALQGVDDHNAGQNAHESHRPRPRLLRIPART